MFAFIYTILSAACTACVADDIVNHIPLDKCSPVVATWFAVVFGILAISEYIGIARDAIIENIKNIEKK